MSPMLVHRRQLMFIIPKIPIRPYQPSLSCAARGNWHCKAIQCQQRRCQADYHRGASRTSAPPLSRQNAVKQVPPTTPVDAGNGLTGSRPSTLPGPVGTPPSPQSVSASSSGQSTSSGTRITLGNAIAVLLVTAGAGTAGYYSLFASDEEKRKLDNYLSQLGLKRDDASLVPDKILTDDNAVTLPSEILADPDKPSDSPYLSTPTEGTKQAEGDATEGRARFVEKGLGETLFERAGQLLQEGQAKVAEVIGEGRKAKEAGRAIEDSEIDVKGTERDVGDSLREDAAPDWRDLQVKREDEGEGLSRNLADQVLEDAGTQEDVKDRLRRKVDKDFPAVEIDIQDAPHSAIQDGSHAASDEVDISDMRRRPVGLLETGEQRPVIDDDTMLGQQRIDMRPRATPPQERALGSSQLPDKNASTKQEEAALAHFRTFEARAKDLRFETLTRAAEEALAQGEALRRHLDHSLLRDLGSLPADALQHRVIQLAGELQERTKWEALRLLEAVKRAEIEISNKYTELIGQLRRESEDELGKQARALRSEKEVAVTKIQEDKLEEYQQRLEAERALLTANFADAKAKAQSELEEKTRRDIENATYDYQEKTMTATNARLEELSKLRNAVDALNEVFATNSDYEHVSHQVHRVSAAIMAVEGKLLNSDPLPEELDVLHKLTSEDKILEVVLKALPQSIVDGVPTVSELQARFERVESAAREAAFVPDKAPTLFGHLFGSALAALTLKPKGLVEGPGAAEILARAAHHLDRGQLAESVKELQTLEGLPAKVVQDWLRDANARLLLQQALRVMCARSALLNISLA